jgi:RimJ/RimL family protein N-acetyltransferase
LTEVRLQVYTENNAAIRAYEKAGFKQIMTEMRYEL